MLLGELWDERYKIIVGTPYSAVTTGVTASAFST